MEMVDLLKLGVEKKASDLHVLPGHPPLLRLDGELQVIPEIGDTPLTPEQTKEIIFGIMTPQQIDIFEKKLVTDMSLVIPNLGNFRVSVLHQLRGIAAVMRIIPEAIPSIDDLGLPRSMKSLVTLSHGLILVSGATGSGKSTTLASMINEINMTQAAHIITIEDPIEYIYHSKKSVFNQLQVGRDTPDMETALRAALRQDPDVILLGEMRDLETIRLALTAAETGHLVLSTLHARTAPTSVSRIVDVFPNEEKNRVRNMLSESIQAVISQTLVKKATGQGRVAAVEIMIATPAIRHMIKQDQTAHIESTIQTNTDKGMCTMDQYLRELVAKKLITNSAARLLSQSRSAYKETE